MTFMTRDDDVKIDDYWKKSDDDCFLVLVKTLIGRCRRACEL